MLGGRNCWSCWPNEGCIWGSSVRNNIRAPKWINHHIVQKGWQRKGYLLAPATHKDTDKVCLSITRLRWNLSWHAHLRAEIVHWVSESAQPFKIVKDCGFQSLMKTGCPKYYIPSPSTVFCDIQMVFVHTYQRIATMLQVSRCCFGASLKRHWENTVIQWQTEFCNWCMNIPQPQGICSTYSSPWAGWYTAMPCIRYCWGCTSMDVPCFKATIHWQAHSIVPFWP